jgi:hypothetical protein
MSTHASRRVAAPRGARVLVVAVAGASALFALAGGPAGAASSKPTAKQWAGSVCSAFLTFGSSVESTIEGLKSAGSVEDAATAAKQGIQDATKELQSTLDDLGKPPTPNGTQAQTTIQDLGKDLTADANDIEQALTPAPSSPGDVASAFATIGSDVQKAVSQTKDAANTLKGLKGDSALRKGFESASSCQQLKSDL